MIINKFLPLSLFALLILSCPASGQTFQVLHTFAAPPADGPPTTPLLLDTKGRLFFASPSGGQNTECDTGCGALFELSKGYGRWKENVVFSFDLVNGYQISPQGSLVSDSSGNIYGSQSGNGDLSCNCGSVYQLTQNVGVWTENVLHNFLGGASDGTYPNSGLVRDSSGNLYGATSFGGLNNNGTVFELTPNSDGTWAYSVIHNFSYGVNNSLDGSIPAGPLTIDSLGNLYGTTIAGGLWQEGTVFRLSPSAGSWTESVLFNFTVDYGNTPQPWGVVPDAAGNLYGTTTTGGAYGIGTIYKLTPARGFWSRVILHTFTGSGDGAYPLGGLTIDSTGALYGVCELGGSFGYGNVYKFARVSGRWTQTLLHEFTNGTDGARPGFGVILDWRGNVYGVADAGGAYENGVAFEITP